MPDQDPPPAPHAVLEDLRSSLSDIPRLAASLSGPAAGRRPSAGGWSAGAVLGHLADTEQVYGVRLRMVLAADRPPLGAFDQEAWAVRFAGLESVEESVARWSLLRRSNLRLLESLDGAGWARVGLHAERGEESVAAMAALLARHDRAHADQARRAAGGA